MKSLHANVYEFSMHIKEEMNLSLFSFSEFCTLKEQELSRIAYMKDRVLYEAVPIKFVSSILELYYIFYEFLNQGWTSN
jgi:hypothetical protein